MTARLPIARRPIARRTVLKGVAAASAVASSAALPAAPLGAPLGAVRFIIDARLPEAAALAARAALDGHRVADPGGEMIALLLGDGPRLLAAGGHLIGLTGYADFALAQDLLRGIGRPVRHALAIDAVGTRSIVPARSPREARALAALLGADVPESKHRATSFAWLA